jgi:hypothetical protein
MLLQSYRVALTAAAFASATMLAPSAAEAGRRTGTWRYGPPAHYQQYYGAGPHHGAPHAWKMYQNPNTYRGRPGVYGRPAYRGHPQPAYGYRGHNYPARGYPYGY